MAHSFIIELENFYRKTLNVETTQSLRLNRGRNSIVDRPRKRQLRRGQEYYSIHAVLNGEILRLTEELNRMQNLNVP